MKVKYIRTCQKRKSHSSFLSLLTLLFKPSKLKLKAGLKDMAVFSDK